MKFHFEVEFQNLTPELKLESHSGVGWNLNFKISLRSGVEFEFQNLTPELKLESHSGVGWNLTLRGGISPEFCAEIHRHAFQEMAT